MSSLVKEAAVGCKRGCSPRGAEIQLLGSDFRPMLAEAKLECFAGTLSPNSYICAQDDCAAVTGLVED